MRKNPHSPVLTGLLFHTQWQLSGVPVYIRRHYGGWLVTYQVADDPRYCAEMHFGNAGAWNDARRFASDKKRLLLEAINIATKENDDEQSD